MDKWNEKPAERTINKTCHNQNISLVFLRKNRKENEQFLDLLSNSDLFM